MPVTARAYCCATRSSMTAPGQACRQVAACVIRSDSAFGAFYRRKKAQLGPRQALVRHRPQNTALRPRTKSPQHSGRGVGARVARTVYHLLKSKTAYHDLGAERYEQQFQERELAHLRQKAAKLGYVLTATEA